MSYKNLISKVRYWDNLTAKWFLRHFYFMFFQIVLVMIFILWFINLFSVFDTNLQVPQDSLTERILATQSIYTAIIVFLMLLNSFWILFIFNAIQRLANLLKDIGYHLSRLRSPGK